MSFFDDDEPPTRAARPRRPARPRTAATGARGAGPTDAQQLMMRRALALGAGVVVLIVLVLGVKGCLNSRADSALRDYNSNVNAIVSDSNSQVSKRLFDLLSTSGGYSIALIQKVNQLRVTADDDFKRAQALSVPSPMEQAQQHLLLALSLRSEGVASIASDLRDIGGDRKRAAVARIAATMREFLASDVVFSQRIDPYIMEALAGHGINGQDTVASRFLPDDTWLAAATVGNRLGIAGATSRPGKTPCASTCGHGLTSVAVGGVTLDAAASNNHVVATDATSAGAGITVNFQNQGQTDEFGVLVKISITGSSLSKPITAQKTVDETKAGQAASTQIRLLTTPPIGVPVRVKVLIVPVPGEVTTSNNSQTYVVTFSR